MNHGLVISNNLFLVMLNKTMKINFISFHPFTLKVVEVCLFEVEVTLLNSIMHWQTHDEALPRPTSFWILKVHYRFFLRDQPQNGVLSVHKIYKFIWYFLCRFANCKTHGHRTQHLLHNVLQRDIELFRQYIAWFTKEFIHIPDLHLIMAMQHS